jgi:hypothetical protein
MLRPFEMQSRVIRKSKARSPPLGRLLCNRLPGNGWHQTLKSRILLENYFLPGDLEAFVDNYNHQRYHESLNNVTPSDVYFGRDKALLQQRERIKRKTLEARRLHHRQHAA